MLKKKLLAIVLSAVMLIPAYAVSAEELPTDEAGSFSVDINEEVVSQITYELNGGTNDPANPSSYSVGEESITLLSPVRRGYTFAGWFLDAECKEEITNIDTSIATDITVYAKWTANHYTIRFCANGGSGKMSAVTVLYDQVIKLPGNKFTKSYYTFAGWGTKKGDSVVTYPDRVSVKNLAIKNGKIIDLYAQWKPTEYKITYYLNGGTNNKNNPETYNKFSGIVTLKNPTRKGYTFKGWYLDKKLTKKITNIPSGSTGTKKVFAKWQKKRIVIDSDGEPHYYKTDGTESFSIPDEFKEKYYTALAAYLDTGNNDQMILVSGKGQKAVLVMLQKDKKGKWKMLFYENDTWLATNGIGKAKEGSRTTPAGRFEFCKAFGIKNDPGTSLQYTKVNASHYWVDDVNSKYYNKFVSTKKVKKDWKSAEHLIEETPWYNYALALNYNEECIPGEGSAFFLHVTHNSSTAGCVAVPESTMIKIMKKVKNGCEIIIFKNNDFKNTAVMTNPTTKE